MSENENGNGPVIGTPPYVGFKTWVNFLGDLKQSAVPPEIDNSVMRGKSGSAQSALKTALRFFELTDEEGRTRDSLRALVEVHGTDDWPDTLKFLITASYEPIVGGLPLKTATGQQLNDRFRKRTGITSTTLSKAVRFYLSALEAAGIEHSPYFKAPAVKRSPSSKRAPKTPTKPGAGTVEDSSKLPIPEGMATHAFNIPGRPDPVRVVAYRDITAAEWKMAASFMEAYIALGEVKANE